MPLVVVCGLPCSGKTRRAEELAEYLRSSKDKEVKVVADDFGSGGSRDGCYASSREEKTVRGALKSSVERLLTPDHIIILDSLNYIKGYRYELFCVAKHFKTTLCLLFCATPPETAMEWNEARPSQDRYSTEVFDALAMRFEEPDSRNRWDSPLIVVAPDDALPGQAIADALFNRKAPPPNQSTQSQPLSDVSFLHDLDRRTQEVVGVVLEAQRSGTAGGVVMIPGSGEPLCLVRSTTMAELRRLRRQFIAYSKMHPVADGNAIPTLFVQYLNSTLT